MKNYFKTSKWLRWVVAGAFGLMMVLNIMVGLGFEKSDMLPSLTMVELGNMVFAQGEGDPGGWLWESSETSTPCERTICWLPGGILCDTFYGYKWECVDGWSWCVAHCEA